VLVEVVVVVGPWIEPKKKYAWLSTHTTGNWQNSTLYPPVPQLAVLLDFQVSHYECILLNFLAIDITIKEQTCLISKFLVLL